jgi:hypothetical protein
MIMYGVVHKDFLESFTVVLLGADKEEAISLWNYRNFGTRNHTLSKDNKKNGWKVFKFNIEAIS